MTSKGGSTGKEGSPVRLGIVGCGFVGQVAHIRNYADLPGCRIVALADQRPGLRDAVAARYGISRVYETHRELLEDSGDAIDAVVAVTQRDATGPVALECLSAGKHVLTEKPMCATVAQGEELARAADAAGRVYAVGYMRRYDPGVRWAKEKISAMIRSGEYGPVTYARAHCFTGDSYCNIDGAIQPTEEKPESVVRWDMAPEWLPADRHGDYEYFLNTYCHNINLLRHLTGETPEVRHADLSSRDGSAVSLRFKGYPGVLETGRSTCRGWDEVTEIFFRDARVTVRTPPAFVRNLPAKVEVTIGGGDKHRIIHEPDWIWAFREQAGAYLEAVRSGKDPLSNGRDGVEDLRIAEAAWKSAIRG